MQNESGVRRRGRMPRVKIGLLQEEENFALLYNLSYIYISTYMYTHLCQKKKKNHVKIYQNLQKYIRSFVCHA